MVLEQLKKFLAIDSKDNLREYFYSSKIITYKLRNYRKIPDKTHAASVYYLNKNMDFANPVSMLLIITLITNTKSVIKPVEHVDESYEKRQLNDFRIIKP